MCNFCRYVYCMGFRTLACMHIDCYHRKDAGRSPVGRLTQSNFYSLSHVLLANMTLIMHVWYSGASSLPMHGSLHPLFYHLLITLHMLHCRTRRTVLGSQSPSSACSEWCDWSNCWAGGRASGLCCGPSSSPSRWDYDSQCDKRLHLAWWVSNYLKLDAG